MGSVTAIIPKAKVNKRSSSNSKGQSGILQKVSSKTFEQNVSLRNNKNSKSEFVSIDSKNKEISSINTITGLPLEKSKLITRNNIYQHQGKTSRDPELPLSKQYHRKNNSMIPPMVTANLKAALHQRSFSRLDV